MRYAMGAVSQNEGNINLGIRGIEVYAAVVLGIISPIAASEYILP
jgi:hypothetical protein